MPTATQTSAIILDTSVKATLLLALAWSATLILKKRSAATRHLVRVFALAALLLLPFSALLLPAWHVKGVPDFTATTSAHANPTASMAPARPAATSLPARVGLAPALSTERATGAGRRQFQSEAMRASIPAMSPERSSATQKSMIAPSAVSKASFELSSQPGAVTDSLSTSMQQTTWRVYITVFFMLIWAAGALCFLV